MGGKSMKCVALALVLVVVAGLVVGWVLFHYVTRDGAGPEERYR